jgi:hypothetical protein
MQPANLARGMVPFNRLHRSGDLTTGVTSNVLERVNRWFRRTFPSHATAWLQDRFRLNGSCRQYGEIVAHQIIST